MNNNYQSYLIRKAFLDKANLIYVGIGLNKFCTRYKGHLEAILEQRENVHKPGADAFCNFYNTETGKNIPFPDMFELAPANFEGDMARKQRGIDEVRAKRQNAMVQAKKLEEAKKEATKKIREREIEELAETIYKDKIKE